MSQPKVSVLLPVYNAEAYLGDAIDSVLRQTFTDFELLLLDDGSTDGSAAVIASRNDPRIRYLPNDRNRGLVYTLNRGIDLANGSYIARMDADDICFPRRFELQCAYLDQDPGLALVAGFVAMMDASGKALPPWKEDRENSTPSAIRSCLLHTNCIAHPSIMMRAGLMRSFRYRPEQKEAEDYDLWLRLASEDFKIAKVEEEVLRYRVLQTGLTKKEKLSGFERQARTKKLFLDERKASGKMNAWCRKLAWYYRRDRLFAFVKKLLRR